MTSLFVPQWLLHCCILTGTGLGMGIQTPKIDPVPGLRSSQSSGRDRHQMSNFKLEMETHSLVGFNCVAEVAGKTHEGDCLGAEHQRQCPSKWKSRRRNCRQRYSPWGSLGWEHKGDSGAQQMAIMAGVKALRWTVRGEAGPGCTAQPPAQPAGPLPTLLLRAPGLSHLSDCPFSISLSSSPFSSHCMPSLLTTLQ